MRFDQIAIPAFGPFTDFSLALPPSDHDLHVIYGPNERGKSSLLRSLDHLLFGIPVRTTDNFIHANPKLRIGATITGPSQTTLAFQRKKGNANTLLDTKGNTLEETKLEAFLGPVNREFFSSMFGLNTASLREGAQALIAGEGALGSALFSASLGNTDIDAAIAKLETQANALFKGKSRSLKIPQAIAAYKDCEKQIREATIKVSAWKSHQKDLAAAQEVFDQADELQVASNQQKLKLQRYLSAHKLAARLAPAKSQLAELATIPELPSDFPNRVRTAQEAIQRLRQSRESNERILTDLQAQIAAVLIQPAFIERSEDIEVIHQSIAAHRGRLSQRPILQANAEATTKELEQALQQVGLGAEQLSSLPVITTELVSEVGKLKEQRRRQEDAVDHAKTRLERLQNELLAVSKELADSPTPESSAELKALNMRAANAQRASENQKELVAAIDARSRQLQAQIARWQISPQDTARIPQFAPPSPDAIHSEKAKCESLTARIVKQRDDLADIDTRLAKERSQLEALRSRGARYDEANLLETRQQRDLQLREALEAWAKGEAANLILGQQLTASIQSADAIADSLRQHAEQIALAEKHTHNITSLQAERKGLETSLKASQADLDHWHAEWDKRCLAIPAPVQPPQDLLDWVKGWQQLCEDLESNQRDQDEAARLTEEMEATQRALSSAMDKPDADLPTLIALLETRLDFMAEASGTHKERVKQQGKLKAEISKVTEELEAAQASSISLQARLDPLVSPYPQSSLESLRAAQNLLLERGKQERLIAAEEAAISDTNQRIADLAHALLPDEATHDSEKRAQQLWTSLAAAKEAASQSKVLTERMAKAQADLSADDAALKGATALLSELQKLCGAIDDTSLEAILADLEKRRALEAAIKENQDHLAGMSAGEELEAFIQGATKRSADELQLEMESLGSLLEERKVARDAAREQLNALKAADRQFQEASDAASAHQQQAHFHLAAIVTDARRFRELQLAIQFLRQQIEVYREKTQGPMVQSTSQYFAALTRDAFSGVAAQMNDKGEPQLVGVREDGSFVSTRVMSEGTADQLYLALRLAAIDLHLAAHSAMPLVLDDLLITFDDERTTALLPILAKLAQKTQILVFTHHQHLLELFQRALPEQHTAHHL